MAKRPKQETLPTMEDRAIKPLQDAAHEYAEIRDERIALNQREADLKNKVRTLMHKHNKTRYAYEGVEIELLPPDGEEQVKVKVKKPADGDPGEGE